MPCRCDFDDYTPPQNVNKTMHENNKTTRENKTIENLRNQQAALGKMYNDLKADDDRVTQLLCYVCGSIIYMYGGFSELDDRLFKWWKEHDDWDRHRTLENFKRQFTSNSDQCPTKDDVYKWFVERAESVHPLSEYHKHEFFNWVWDEFVDWFNGRKRRADRIAELEAELAKLKAEEDA